MGDQRHSSTLSQPLIPTHTTVVDPPNDDDEYKYHEKTKRIVCSMSSYSGIACRLVFVLFIATLSIWASYESSKGFEISIVNQLSRDSPAGKRFDLFYVSDDKATRVVLNASKFIEDLLYDESSPRKPVSHVTLRLSNKKFSGEVDVSPSGEDPRGFVVDISPQVMEASDVDNAMTSAVLRGMARVWLWDGESTVPPGVLSGVVEYIATAAGFGHRGGAEVAAIGCGQDHRWYKEEDPRSMARLLGCCEERDKGFIRRLNGAMRDRWDGWAVAGVPVDYVISRGKIFGGTVDV